jgi:hypothetical protein
MDYLGSAMMIATFVFFGWLMYKYSEKAISGLAAWFLVAIVAILQLCMEATFDEIGAGYMLFSLALMFFALVMTFIMSKVESRKPWAKEDRVLKTIHDIVE